MPRIYFYKLTADNGGAPCVQDGLLSLAICKPMIRTTAELEDVIFGFAANSLHRANRLIYIARIGKKVCNGDYYREKRFANRGDCVYEWHRSRFVWRQRALHHGPEDLGSRKDGPHLIGRKSKARPDQHGVEFSFVDRGSAHGAFLLTV